MKLNAEHIDRLFRERMAEIWRRAAARTLNAQVAFDLTAETFAQALVDREQFAGDTWAEVGAWIDAIARNRTNDYLRRGTVERAALTRLGHEIRVLSTDEVEQVERAADFRELREPIAAALESLPQGLRDAVRLRIVEELPYADVAARLEITEQAARARVSRALTALRNTPPFVQLREELS